MGAMVQQGKECQTVERKDRGHGGLDRCATPKFLVPWETQTLLSLSRWWQLSHTCSHVHSEWTCGSVDILNALRGLLKGITQRNR